MRADLLSTKITKGRNKFGRTRLFVRAAGNKMYREETDTRICAGFMWL